MNATPVLELITKQGCHLCQDARAVMDEVTGERGMAWSELDASERPELLERFAEEIPVLLIDGVQRDFWRIDPVRLRGLLGA